MVSFLKKIFGAFGGAPSENSAAGPAVEPQQHDGCTIYAEPIKDGGQYRLAGRIEKDVNGAVLTRGFIRADVFTTMDDAVDATFRKARQIIDQNGASLFADGEASRNC